MKILYGKCFGIGNAVMAVPAIRALSDVFGPIDVLIGTTSDDGGAREVMQELRDNSDCINRIWFDSVPDQSYDVAIMAIPFDGRWRKGIHFYADQVIDGRPRPGDPTVLGLHMWEKHESAYQMENLDALVGPHDPRIRAEMFDLPARSAFLRQESGDLDLVYLGLGFKRDKNSFWSQKHWGNDSFVRFVKRVLEVRPQTKFVTTGGIVDLPVITDVRERTDNAVMANHLDLKTSFKVVRAAGSFFGNDTGMAHVAASCGRPTYVMTAFKGSEVKNPPLGQSRCNPFHREDGNVPMSPESVADDFIAFVWGNG